jgi:hypothetical protein
MEPQGHTCFSFNAAQRSVTCMHCHTRVTYATEQVHHITKGQRAILGCSTCHYVNEAGAPAECDTKIVLFPDNQHCCVLIVMYDEEEETNE